MPSFTKLEKAALDGIFAETPELAPILEQQFDKAAVTNRENTGGGFFTTIEVREDAPRVNGPRVLGCETHARVEGLTHGLGFVLFMRMADCICSKDMRWDRKTPHSSILKT